MTGDHHKKITHAIKTFSQIRASNKVWRKLDARKVASVFAVRHHGLKQVQLNDPAKPDASTGACEL